MFLSLNFPAARDSAPIQKSLIFIVYLREQRRLGFKGETFISVLFSNLEQTTGNFLSSMVWFVSEVLHRWVWFSALSLRLRGTGATGMMLSGWKTAPTLENIVFDHKCILVKSNKIRFTIAC